MTMFIAELYVAAMMATGAVVGFYLHLHLKKNDQISVKTPSPFRDYSRQTRWIDYEAGAHA